MFELNPKPPPIEPSSATHGRILQLDGLRAVAILAVLLQHNFKTPLMWVGVDIFFVLSGFLITCILLARKKSGGGYFTYFYRRRGFRIFLPTSAPSSSTVSCSPSKTCIPGTCLPFLA